VTTSIFHASVKIDGRTHSDGMGRKGYTIACKADRRVGPDPSIVVVDGLSSAGSDGCHSSNWKLLVSTPTAPTDVAKEHQPWLKGLWYYPVFVIPFNLVPKFGLTFSSSN
jgi:hypothetical protein